MGWGADRGDMGPAKLTRPQWLVYVRSSSNVCPFWHVDLTKGTVPFVRSPGWAQHPAAKRRQRGSRERPRYAICRPASVQMLRGRTANRVGRSLSRTAAEAQLFRFREKAFTRRCRTAAARAPPGTRRPWCPCRSRRWRAGRRGGRGPTGGRSGRARPAARCRWVG